jgi:Flp pilus assembly protein TadD
LKLARFANAVGDASESLRLRPRCPRALAVRGAAKRQQGDVDGARADLEAALRENAGRSLLAHLRR